MALSDSIEKFICELMADATSLDIRRNELAQHFGCAPSQINYVLATRFSVNRGYIVETHRGGSGFVRVMRVTGENEDALCALLERIGDSIDMDSARGIIERLYDIKLISSREARLVLAAVELNGLPLAAKDVVRANVLKNTVEQIFKEEARKDAL